MTGDAMGSGRRVVPFTDSWTIDSTGAPRRAVDLPHDAMLAEPRSAAAPSGSHGAYFPGGRYRYRKVWQAPADVAAQRLSLRFEGVAGRTRVRVNDVDAATWDSTYREVEVPLGGLVRAGAENVIEVDVDNSAQPSSRWYTGSGIYRRVWLEAVPAIHVDRHGVALTTRRSGSDATVRVGVPVLGDSEDGDVVSAALFDADVTVARATGSVAHGVAQLELPVPQATFWSAERPHLYELALRLARHGRELDAVTLRIGLRTIEVGPEFGLRVNGETVLLRGACVHHDNGVLGAATFRAAEFRRARLLKDAGYNAVRSAHNPLSRDFLDACDEIGLYVVDELTDVWFRSKTAFDGADRFAETWRDDARSMVRKDRLHPSVIMYSIGNENAETSTADGVAVARDLRAFVHDLDADRAVTAGVNFMLNAIAARTGMKADTTPPKADGTQNRPSWISSTMINAIANRLGRLTQLLSRLPGADRATRDVMAELDVAGYNYAWSRYEADGRRYPTRVILGTESLFGELPEIWSRVEPLPHVIGDFAWTGWDYLGETGIGTWEYDAGRRSSLLAKPYPALVAGSGAFDITGVPGAPLALQRAVWGLASVPAIMVRPVDLTGAKVQRTSWRSSDAVASWSWSGCEGRVAEIEVYSADESVELLLNGRRVGRRPAGPRAGFVARFRVPYEPGELVAVGYRDGRETGRSSLRSAEAVSLRLRSEAAAIEADGDDLAFVWLELADEHGEVEMCATDTVSLTVTGSARLAGFGSAAPATEESFADPEHTTYRGRALAVLRAARGAGVTEIEATGAHFGSDRLLVQVIEPSGQRY
ncbi:glycoside hydrolase family 2 TIM barrel-domain containing protein [Agromyces indicus]|uniref:Glycoside hydrolase family 2 TIM barrel-domain containing protein n=1 Tax=Agromyces indicus TaxID=758919 RepID=A0ABU1FFN9_9MICO|nr:glycoside hydrolase family 2 TIM barrel-domain containing protein [Agromyces indicus]MDR5690587.1 glycoside hydrolase family 2 TIM barrel-domain containing protein [Agromyces indicus]